MKKLSFLAIFLIFIFVFSGVSPARAITAGQINLIKAQIADILAKISEIQKQIDALRAEEQNALNNNSTAQNIIYKSLSVAYPNNGENLIAGTNYAIKWNSTGLDAAKINISLKQNEIYIIENIASAVLNTGSFNWQIPAGLLGNNYKIYIEAVDGQGNIITSASSASYFSIIQVVR